MQKFDCTQLPKFPGLSFELDLWSSGFSLVAGIDEAGRGALAGPVAAAVLVLPPDPGMPQVLHGVRDSKQISPARREHWAELLKQVAISHGIGFASNQEIDDLGIVPATHLAVLRALQNLSSPPQHLLLDYMSRLDYPAPQTILVKGDRRCLSIAGASILAKVSRDNLMRQLDIDYPGYGFAAHKGYGTCLHRHALSSLGPCPIHRRSFHLHSQSS